MGLALIKQESFGNTVCNLYRNSNDEVLMTREQIGTALEYKDPQNAIDKLHERHRARLDKFSVTVKVSGADGKKYNTCLYTSKGIYEICRWSQQKKADEFMDWVWDVIDNVKKLLQQKSTIEWRETRQQGKLFQKDLGDEIKNFEEYAKSQGSNNYKMYYKHFAKLCNASIGIKDGERDYTEQRKLTTLTYVIDVIKRTLMEEMLKGTHYKQIYIICKNQVSGLLSYIQPKRIAV